jgi:hypothetical protein
MNKPYVWAFLVLAFPLTVIAKTPALCIAKFDEGAQLYFANSLDEAKDALSDICRAIAKDGVTEKELYNTLLDFHLKLKQDAVKAMPQLAEHLNIFDKPLFEVQGEVATGMIPDYIIDYTDPLDPSVVGGIEFYYQGNGRREGVKVPKVNAESCIKDEECAKALIAYRKILKDVYRPLAAEPLQLTYDFLTLKDKEWTTYIEDARSQTFVDIVVTSWLYEWAFGKGDHDFRSPPKVQWFALRPNVLIENVSSAADGDQVKESLALEVIGLNYWEDACFGLACGASIIVNYSDRNGVDDTGWGLMLHVDNSYSFGVTDHGGETGLFVTVDLLKLFQDKKSSFDDYKEKFRLLGE